MQNISAKYIDSRITALAAYQVIGGVIGLYYLIVLLTSAGHIPPLFIAIIAVGFLCYGFSVACGVLLFKDRGLGARLSIINQLLQVCSFSLFGFGFEYVSGISTTVNIDVAPSFNVEFNSGISNWYMLLNGDGEINRIGFNVVTIFLVLFIIRLRKRIDQHELEELQFNEEEEHLNP